MSDSNHGSLDYQDGNDRQSMDDCDQQRESVQSITERRLQQVEQFQTEALENPDPLNASLLAFSGALMRMGLRMEASLEQALAKHPMSAGHSSRVRLALESYLKCLRQADRYVQLGRPRPATQPASKPSKPR